MPKVPEPTDAADAAPAGKARKTPKKKLFIMLMALVVVLAAAAGGGLWFLKKQRDALAAENGEAPVEAVAEEQHDEHPPTFMALDNLVVNLADPGGERFAQVGITFEVADSKAEEKIKAYLPSIRSSILLLLSQRTAAELLQREGKEKLAQDILVETARPFGGNAKPADKGAKKKGKAGAEPAGPVRRVLFSSFIIQ